MPHIDVCAEFPRVGDARVRGQYEYLRQSLFNQRQDECNETYWSVSGSRGSDCHGGRSRCRTAKSWFEWVLWLMGFFGGIRQKLRIFGRTSSQQAIVQIFRQLWFIGIQRRQLRFVWIRWQLQRPLCCCNLYGSAADIFFGSV